MDAKLSEDDPRGFSFSARVFVSICRTPFTGVLGPCQLDATFDILCYGFQEDIESRKPLHSLMV